MKKFDKLLKKELIKNCNNSFNDNFDYYRFSSKKNNRKKGLIKKYFKKIILSNQILLRICFAITPIKMRYYGEIYNYLNGISNLYKNLSNKESKELLLKIVAFRIQGHKKVKLPLNTNEYWDGIKMLENEQDFSSFISSTFLEKKRKLFKINLNKIGYPLDLYASPNGAHIMFSVKQYAYKNIVLAQKNDIVLDFGGCNGDTALYFAHEVGEKGFVYSFEFIPSNISVMGKNLEINKKIKNIKIVTKPGWKYSNEIIYYKDKGPGSRISFDKINNYDGEAKTINIDDFVKINNLDRVDFIKMDVEGAEPFVLEGGKESIQRFAPKLAISIYHNMDDFTKIVNQIKEFDNRYRFYLGHSSIHLEETILFAIIE